MSKRALSLLLSLVMVLVGVSAVFAEKTYPDGTLPFTPRGNPTSGNCSTGLQLSALRLMLM